MCAPLTLPQVDASLAATLAAFDTFDRGRLPFGKRREHPARSDWTLKMCTGKSECGPEVSTWRSGLLAANCEMTTRKIRAGW